MLFRSALASRAVWQKTQCLATRAPSALSVLSAEKQGAGALLATSPLALMQSRYANSTAVMPGSHATMFKAERLWALGMLPLFPAAYFVHGPIMDYALAVAISLHAHWGLHVVVEDYARPFLLGEGLSRVCAGAVYVVSILILAGLIHFNYNDVGITKAFEMVWAL